MDRELTLLLAEKEEEKEEEDEEAVANRRRWSLLAGDEVREQAMKRHQSLRCNQVRGQLGPREIFRVGAGLKAFNRVPNQPTTRE